MASINGEHGAFVQCGISVTQQEDFSIRLKQEKFIEDFPRSTTTTRSTSNREREESVKRSARKFKLVVWADMFSVFSGC